MGTKPKKILLLVVKLGIAAALMTWVLSKVYWHDYVTDRQGKSHALLEQKEGPTRTVVVDSGPFWRQEKSERLRTDFRPFKDGGDPNDVVFPGFRSSLLNINKALLAVGFCGFGISMLIIAVRWWFLLRLQDIRIRFWEVIRLTFLGQFFNQVVPGTVGGDLVKAYYVSKHTPKKAAVLVSVFVDRVLGLTELTLLAAVMVVAVLIGGMETFDTVREPVLYVVVVTGIVVMALVFLLSSRFRSMFHLQRFYQRLSIARHVAAAGDAARLYRQRLPALLKAIGATFGAQFVWIMSITLLGVSIGLSEHIKWYNYFTYIPLIYIIGAIPLTPGGVGIVEGFYIRFFSMVNPSAILVLAMLARIIPILWGLPGIIVAVTGPKLPKVEQMQAELQVATKTDAEAGK
jgi:hypothetical protein